MAAKKTPAAKTTASPKRKTAHTPEASAPKQPRSGGKTAKAGDQAVILDRRRGARRGEEAEVAIPETAEPQLERREKVQRRRQIDPTTCERDYSVEEVEFMNAMDDYKRKNGRMFPTCSEVLEVIRTLGYVRLSPAGRAMLAADGASSEGASHVEEEALTPEDFAF